MWFATGLTAVAGLLGLLRIRNGPRRGVRGEDCVAGQLGAPAPA
jgi:hypothetical protein